MSLSVLIYFSVLIGILAGFIGYTAGKVMRIYDELQIIERMIRDVSVTSRKHGERMREQDG